MALLGSSAGEDLQGTGLRVPWHLSRVHECLQGKGLGVCGLGFYVIRVSGDELAIGAGAFSSSNDSRVAGQVPAFLLV